MITHRTLLAPLAVAPLALVLAACVTTSEAPPAPPPAFVEAACGGCHAVEAPFLSPNPRAPSFAAIANRPGVTKATVHAWLVNAHNYPEQMDFTLEQDHIDQIERYLVTLKRSDYVPVE